MTTNYKLTMPSPELASVLGINVERISKNTSVFLMGVVFALDSIWHSTEVKILRMTNKEVFISCNNMVFASLLEEKFKPYGIVLEEIKEPSITYTPVEVVERRGIPN